MCLTVQDSGVPNLTLHGPQGLDEIFKAMRKFVILKDLKVEAPACDATTVYDDCVMNVSYVPIIRSENANAMSEQNNNDDLPPQEDTTDYYAHECKYEIKNILNQLHY